MRTFVTTSLIGAAATALLTGCPDRTISEVNPEQGRVEFKNIPISVNRNIDILFVVDDSGSMLDKQANIRDNFPNFINVLDTIVGGRPDLHIGVISTDVGARGAEEATGTANFGNCTGNGKAGNLLKGQATELNGQYISDVAGAPGTRVTNYGDDSGNSLAEVFGKMASLGAAGCGFEAPLDAMKRALNNNPSNTGFIRDDAYLAVIFLTDEDDCSFNRGQDIYAADNAATGIRQSFRCTRFGVLCEGGGADTTAMNQVGVKTGCRSNEQSSLIAPVTDYVNFLKGVKPGNEDKIIVAGIMGTTEPFAVELRAPPMSQTQIPALARSCTYQGVPNSENPTGTQVADPPVRMRNFLDAFPDRSTFTTICQRDLSGGLQQIAQLLKTVIGDPCIEGSLADVDPDTAGAQYDCSVSWVSEGIPERILPPCEDDDSNAPCWRIEIDTEQCTGGSNLILRIEQGNETPPANTNQVAYCVTEAETPDP